MILMTLPSIISLVFTLASPPPGFQTDLSAFNISVEKNDVRWIVMQFVNAVFFPIAAIGRYCSQIFWWVEAVCASRDFDEDRTKEALLEAKSPSPMELYLFLQAFLHSAPHAIVNILDLMMRYSGATFDKVSLQAISIIASALRMASTATVYRRFSREKLSGRRYPWSKVPDNDTENENMKKETQDNTKKDENIYETIKKRDSPFSDARDSGIKSDSDLIQFSPRTTLQSAFYDDIHSDSDNSSDYMPLSPGKYGQTSALDSDDEYIQPVSIIDRVAPRRRDTGYTIERVSITPPPAMPAPRPGSIAVWAEKLVENAEAIPTWLSAPPRRKYCDEVIQSEPDIPRRVPRSYMRGLEPPDATAALVHYLGWYSFFVGRLISIACFINFFPVAAIIVLFCHYQVMLLLLIVPQASTVKRSFYIFLAFIYIFCLMEFKIRFRHVRVWHMFWIILCTIETIIFTALWATIDNNIEVWWRYFIVKVIFGSTVLSYLCFLVYFVLLQPRETIVNIKNKNTGS
ncbi:hypothetical protein O3G_MSEX011332 [Manduca sexta]|uniref:XK-related protein n=2 Tax=Manduca sexta TaxID=7130 RepID=A0A921ZKN5_MANSE|nr:hypothetical protein O3G_MSEX011332 [Manduca sexta]